jgi:hypothetical protein
MSETMSERQYSTDELLDAGASDLFASYYEAAPNNASGRREVEKGVFDLDELNDNPSLGGGFFESLWNGDMIQAIRRADSHNAKILEEVTGMTREDTFA